MVAIKETDTLFGLDDRNSMSIVDHFLTMEVCHDDYTVRVNMTIKDSLDVDRFIEWCKDTIPELYEYDDIGHQVDDIEPYGTTGVYTHNDYKGCSITYYNKRRSNIPLMWLSHLITFVQLAGNEER